VNKLLILSSLFLCLFFGSSLSIKDIPVQEEGRIKPFDTFANNQLLRIHGKSSLSKSELSSADWLFGVLTDDSLALSIPVFYIRNPEVVNALELNLNDDRKYNFDDISNSIESKLSMLTSIIQKPEENRGLVEKQLLEIYFNALNFKALRSDLLCLTPIIPVDDSVLTARLDVKIGDKVSFFRFVSRLDKMQDFLDSIETKDMQEWSSAEISFYNIVVTLPELNNMLGESDSGLLKILPPFDNIHGDDWISPWKSISYGKLRTSYHDRILNSLDNFITAKYNDNEKKYNEALNDYQISLFNYKSYELGLLSDLAIFSSSIEFQEKFKKIIENNTDIASLSMLKREVRYNKSNLFTNSIVFYILSFIFVCFSLMFWNKSLRRIAMFLIVIGVGIHFYGILQRMIIMGRPPVSTLYESIIFVGLISVLCSFIIEKSRKDGLGILAASIAGIISLYVSFGYAADGDTMGVLVAVLNSNFWLATHVTTITIGYGTSIVAGIMGHIYLFYAILFPQRKKILQSIYNNTFGITILALFFTLFGTILGGIWADQSWGRFWGWDPKENGALLICMWQIFMIHLRLTGLVKGLGFAAGMVINNIIVALAWFGVNLLSIGLHSYGFASGIAMNLLIFCSIELFISVFGYIAAKARLNYPKAIKSN